MTPEETSTGRLDSGPELNSSAPSAESVTSAASFAVAGSAGDEDDLSGDLKGTCADFFNEGAGLSTARLTPRPIGLVAELSPWAPVTRAEGSRTEGT